MLQVWVGTRRGMYRSVETTIPESEGNTGFIWVDEISDGSIFTEIGILQMKLIMKQLRD